MQVLPLALFIVLLELTAGSFISLFLLDLRGDSSRGFVIFQGVLYALFALLTLGAMNAFASPQIVHGYGLDEPWLAGQGPLTVALLALLVVWNILLWADRDAPKGKGQQQARNLRAMLAQPPLRRARFALGALTALVALADVAVVGMAYRALAASRLDGALVTLAFVAGALALGGVMTAMLLGHWYLNTPTASGKPLEFVTTLTLVALALELALLLFIGPATIHATVSVAHITPGTVIQAGSGGVVVSTPTPAPGATTTPNPTRSTPIDMTAMLWLQYVLGFLSPLILSGVALYLTRGRSFQAATGMLYLAVSFIFIGEILARGLLLFPIFG
ncbi:MAG: hypothetical protein KGO05_14280 [Chloroflexota bacterium]|nr:hypothetical protein [Chloroflexota bacterium]